jgi:hypothetical protein
MWVRRSAGQHEARARTRAEIRRFGKPLADLLERDANVDDTRLLVTDFLCEALGFDKDEELTTECQVKGEFSGYGARIEGRLVAFIGCAVWRPRPSGRGGNAAPSSECRWWWLASWHEISASAHARSRGGVAGALRARPICVESRL